MPEFVQKKWPFKYFTLPTLPIAKHFSSLGKREIRNLTVSMFSDSYLNTESGVSGSNDPMHITLRGNLRLARPRDMHGGDGRTRSQTREPPIKKVLVRLRLKRS